MRKASTADIHLCQEEILTKKELETAVFVTQTVLKTCSHKMFQEFTVYRGSKSSSIGQLESSGGEGSLRGSCPSFSSVALLSSAWTSTGGWWSWCRRLDMRRSIMAPIPLALSSNVRMKKSRISPIRDMKHQKQSASAFSVPKL
ncbi:hypothetical protein E2C01_004765 [Portunus trituberculatus]|uniref:Uncharacterized protein n=1 Tax=Portunus trituberculatus TaxID=210409 RepID=A0A5B7CUT1_PORTR|nr:hypothetical protein [Portunus trituberculatus]